MGRTRSKAGSSDRPLRHTPVTEAPRAFSRRAALRPTWTAASEQGFDLDFYDCNRDSAALPGRIGDYEVIYGHPDPAWLKRADRLRWLCSDFAGVEK